MLFHTHVYFTNYVGAHLCFLGIFAMNLPGGLNNLASIGATTRELDYST